MEEFGFTDYGGELNRYVEMWTGFPQLNIKQFRFVVETERNAHAISTQGEERILGYRALKFVGLVASAITPVLALSPSPKLLTALVAALVFIAEGLVQLTRIQERAALNLSWATELRRELGRFKDHIAPYDLVDSPFDLLIRRVHSVNDQYQAQDLGVIRSTLLNNFPDPGDADKEAGKR